MIAFFARLIGDPRAVATFRQTAVAYRVRTEGRTGFDRRMDYP